MIDNPSRSLLYEFANEFNIENIKINYMNYPFEEIDGITRTCKSRKMESSADMHSEIVKLIHEHNITEVFLYQAGYIISDGKEYIKLRLDWKSSTIY